MTRYQRGLLMLAIQAVMADFELKKNRDNMHFYTCIQVQRQFAKGIAQSMETLTEAEASLLAIEVLDELATDWCKNMGIPDDSEGFITSFVLELKYNGLVPYTMVQPMVVSMRTTWLRYLIEHVPNYPVSDV